MTDDHTSPTVRGVAGLEIDERVVLALRDRLPSVATATVAAVVVEVPSYAGALSGSMGDNIEAAVQMALGGFLRLASGTRGSDPSTPLGPTLEGAYALGRGEARSGRSMDALLSAYRVGARVAWRELAAAAGEAGVAAGTMAQFAELVFGYIDELSAASVAGHSDELSTSGRVRERYLERLGQQLLAGAGADVLVAAAERADWTPPRTLTAVLLPAAQVRGAISLLGQHTLQVGEDLPGLDSDLGEQRYLLLVPDMDGRDRRQLLRVLQGRSAVVGPPRPWTAARASYLRAERVAALLAERPRSGAAAGDGRPVDTEDHLADLVVGADPDAHADLSRRVLAPLEGLRAGSAQRLAETLRSWLLHQGRREAVAEDLHVHAQTVRYRMGQLRELYGDRLDDPRTVLELVLALHGPGQARTPRSPVSPRAGGAAP
ncbi:MAG TPA: helix-turn-helix domain-containing protein [Nocardioidaceae bacterium]|nr:helix-turn-helix domain-containing protein [Nocardioidaceae bacterium]